LARSIEGFGLGPLPVLLLLLSPILLGTAQPAAQSAESNQALAAAPPPAYTGNSGTITLTVNGATFAAKNLTADSDRSANFVFLMNSSAKISISATAPADPYKSSVTTSRLDIDQVTGNSEAEGNTGQLTASGTFNNSLDYNGVGDITINIRFACFINCPLPDPFAQDVVLDFAIIPTVTLESNATSVSVPGAIELQGDVVPVSQWPNLYTFKDGALQQWEGYNFQPLETDSSGHYNTTVSFSQPSQGGSYTFIVNVTSNHPPLISDAVVTAKASVSVDVGSTVTTSSSTEHEALPIIIIPGIGGSELQFSSSGSGCGLVSCHEVWPLIVTPGYFFTDLQLNSDGTQPSGWFVYPTNILDLGTSDVNFYGPLETSLINHGYVLGKSLFVFPYDWRLDNSVHLSKLDSLVNQARIANDSQQVVLVAHSMGGLIATAYVNSSPENAAKVNSIITMGTPFFGSPKVYYGLTEGYALDNFFANVKDFKNMMQNWPGAYQLLPKVPFIETHNGGLPLSTTFDVTYNSAYGFDTLSPNPDMLTSMAAFNALIGTPTAPIFPSGVKLYTIIGYGTQTLSNYTISAPTQKELANDQYVTLNGAKSVLIPVFGDGDGTVPLWGAINKAATIQYYVSPNSGGGAASHGKLPSNTRVQNIVWSIVSESPTKQYQSISSAKLAIDDKTDFTIHSNANLQIIDQNGNMLGWNGGNGSISEDITGGTFIVQDGVQYASIQGTPAPYEVLINGTGTGTFQLTINETSGGRTTSIAYPEVQVANGTVSLLSFNPSEITSSSGPPLSVTSSESTTSYSPTSVSQVTSQSSGTSSSAVAGLLLIAVIAILIIIPVYLLRKRRK